jgi:phosphoglycerate dehydrogenase-like enzyme
VVVVVPYSRSTHHLVGQDVLAAMRPEAFLINLSRGGCVDEPALLAALAAGTIAGAGLDVFNTEPLPVASPFWGLPNVIVTPHIGGMSDTYHEQALPLVAANLDAYARQGAGGLAGRIERNHKESA